MSAQPDGLVPVHVGQPPPGSDEEHMRILVRERGQDRGGGSRSLPRIPAGAAWQANDLEPRWVGQDSSECAAAVEPSIAAGDGADELTRFLDGADRRGEVALLISMIGYAEDPNHRSVFAPHDSVILPVNSRIDGQRLPSGTKPQLADGLAPADRDLALRLINRPPSGPWWALELRGATVQNLGGRGQQIFEPIGTLQPLLVDPLDQPIAAVWVDPSDSQRWYIVPDTTDVDTLLSWLSNQGLPTYVPEALERVRSTQFRDPALQTIAERSAHQALALLVAEYTEARRQRELELSQAETAADSVRYGLLYGSGGTLVTAVNAALTAAGIDVVDLDEEHGDTNSADLLLIADDQRLLTEIKGVGGPAPESLVGALQRHLKTWPQIHPSAPVTGGLLIVNHQHKIRPADRSPEVYNRAAFVKSLDVRVVSTLELFEHWRTENWSALRHSVLGTINSGPRPPEPPVSARRHW